MKKVIEGKMYNTETAECIASYEHSYPSDFNYISEELYRTKKGAFFICGEGGPLSSYSVSLGNNSWGGGDGLRVVSEEEAREFYEEHGDPDDYAKYFSVEEG